MAPICTSGWRFFANLSNGYAAEDIKHSSQAFAGNFPREKSTVKTTIITVLKRIVSFLVDAVMYRLLSPASNPHEPRCCNISHFKTSAKNPSLCLSIAKLLIPILSPKQMTILKIRIILQFFGDSLRGLRVCKNDVVVAGGMESMSNAPKYLVDATNGSRLGHDTTVDGMAKDGLWDVYNDFGMAICAEICADQHKITREQQVTYCLQE
ncbi:unnamed protein product, partial [Vitis vinifera]